MWSVAGRGESRSSSRCKADETTRSGGRASEGKRRERSEGESGSLGLARVGLMCEMASVCNGMQPSAVRMAEGAGLLTSPGEMAGRGAARRARWRGWRALDGLQRRTG